MDTSKLTRDAKHVAATLRELPDGTVITKSGCTIHVPAKYVEKNLAHLDSDIYIAGIYALITPDNKYAVSNTMAMIKITPTDTKRVFINDVEYIEFEFPAGSVVFPNLNLVVNDTMAYHVYDCFVDGAIAPWFMNYVDIGKLFNSSDKHAGIRLGANRAVMEMILATTARQPADKTQYFRHVIFKPEDMSKPIAYVPFKSVIYGPNTTSAKLMGAYFDMGLVSALVNPSERTEKIETLLRK